MLRVYPLGICRWCYCLVLLAAVARAQEQGMHLHLKASTEDKQQPHRRCHGASCIPTQTELRAQIFADLERPTVLPNDMAMAVPGLDGALQSLEDILIAEHGGDESVIARTRGGTVLTFREQIDYDIRVSTSPSIKTVCEVGFLCGQSAVIWLEANPSLKVLTFDDLGYGASAKCLEFIQSRYPGRLELIQGPSQMSIPEYVVTRTQDDHYQGPKCDLVRLDARMEYENRREDFRIMEPMFHCGTLILFNDVCDPVNCHLYNSSNCYFNGLGNCGKQHSPYFEGPTMMLEELIRQGVVEKVDSFFYKHDKFYKSWALARVRCRNAKLRPLPVAPLFKDPGKFAATMRTCYEQGGCPGMLLTS